MKVKIKKPVPKIYFLPSLFTLTSVFFGFLSLTSTFYGKYRWAAWWIIFAACLDGLDGLVARATKTSSDFGLQLDSLADAVSFATSTSLLIYFWALKPAHYAGVFFSFLFAAAGLLRLARFNVKTKTAPDKRYYQGLTVPSASVFIASLVIFHPAPNYDLRVALCVAFIVVIISLLMVSSIRYRNFINYFVNRPIDIKNALALAVIIGGLLFKPKHALLICFTLNALSGPVNYLVTSIKKTLSKKRQAKKSLKTADLNH
ncbi:MAG TPA: CDP-diacylglycerol--serine O-phosphatidyltransferase [Candidatus Saccharicenans sp.]|jgi:CDP-diacylglycerol--serine O-phosphatidyltransferase|nr:CDP-diacylglycerol--serine O-phosphatidyltransferase [Candidatus Saccharicenans sp.]HRD01684.1 CDP-diacylglycerol--serine O-phosphatidyltransferase [Candidatus Saccharicenans sp.]